jgi:hypothetical protein
MNLLAIPSTAAFRARIRLFRFARGTTLIEIAVSTPGKLEKYA